jgi:4-amino-4-deoxy-L-arabinose transferase-like glycosyltransferase
MHRPLSSAVNNASVLDRTLLIVTLLVTAALSLTLSANRLLWQDEFLSFYSDGQPTAREVVDVQLHHPISLDPPTYHLLSHFTMGVIGQSAIALRLPALVGFLLLEVALFALVRRIGGSRAGVIAALFPLLTASFRYSAEGRPYGWLLGLYAVAFACWYIAAQRMPGRWLALVGMGTSIALAITSHYFGVLILVPLVLAELVRIREQRSFDWPMASAMTAGFLDIAIDLPFQRALAPYRTHYYINSVSIRAVSQGYRELFVRYTTWPMFVQKAIALTMVIATIALIAAAWQRFRARPVSEPAALWAGLIGFAVLPFFGFLLGRFVTHTMEVRYVIATLVAFAVSVALVLQRRLMHRTFYLGLYTAMLSVAIAIGIVNISAARAETKAILASMQPSPALLAADPNARIYVQTLGDFYLNTYYVTDPALRNRFSLLYDEPREVAILGHNTNAVTAEYMQHFTTLNMMPYDSFLQEPHPLFLHYDSSWEWVKTDLDRRGTALQPLGHTLRGELYRPELP